ncbi:MAG: hypothetical protein IPK19_24830 [Chloroflexi bacterium]|nr:hypothetical protein [Chloroflexota bacterium]
MEQIGLWGGFILTLMVFSYLLGDNFLYRLAIYIFIGLVAGYVTLLTVESVLLPWLRGTVLSGNLGLQIVGIVPLTLGGLLLFKALGRFHRLATITLAFLIGLGAAVSVVGAVSGTLLPLTNATAAGVAQTEAGALLNGVLIVVGVVCTLVYFQYAARRIPGSELTQRRALVRALSVIGQGVIAVTLGALYGGAILSGLVIFSERIAYLLARIVGS